MKKRTTKAGPPMTQIAADKGKTKARPAKAGMPSPGTWNPGLRFMGLTDRQRADLRTGVAKSVVASTAVITSMMQVKLAGAQAAIAQRGEQIAELKRQVRILRAELDCQRAMWEDALAGDRAVLELRGAPRKLDRNVKVAVSFMSSGAQHAELALEQSRKDHKRRRRREPDVRKMWKQADMPAAKTPKRKK